MKRIAASSLALCLGLLGVLVTPVAAWAAPLPAAYSGSAGGDVVALDLEVLGGLDVADVRLAVSQSDVDSMATRESTATASNLAASVAGLALTVNDTTQTAPPDNAAPETGTIAEITADGISAGALETSVLARYAGDDVCVPGGTLADSQVNSAGITVDPTGVAGILQTGDASTRGVVDLVPEPAGDPLNRAVRSTATGTITGTSFLGGEVDVEIDGPSTLTAIATGEPGGATVEYDPGTVTVTVDGVERVVALGATETFTVAGVGAVAITVNDLAPADVTESTDGQAASGTVSVVTAAVRVGPAGAPTATATVDLLPLRASAVAPDGGIDCPPPPPVLTTPADGSTTTDTTPTFTGTAVPGAEVEIFVDDESIGTTTADANGNFSFTPTIPLAVGDYTASVTQTTPGGTSGPSNENDFRIAPPRPVLTAPADGSATDDTTPPFTGTALPGSTVEIFVDGESIGTTTARADGTFSFTPDEPLPPGDYEAYVTAALNGIESRPSNTNDFVIDIEDPAPPVITSPDDGSTTSDPTPVIRGTGEPGTTVIVSIDGEEVGRDVVDEDGNFTVVPTEPLKPGEYVITAVAVDDAGNRSGPADPVDFTVVAAGTGGPEDDGTDPGNGDPGNEDPGNGGTGDGGTGDGGTGDGGTGSGADTSNAPRESSLADTGGSGAWVALVGPMFLIGGVLPLVRTRRGRRRSQPAALTEVIRSWDPSVRAASK